MFYSLETLKEKYLKPYFVIISTFNTFYQAIIYNTHIMQAYYFRLTKIELPCFSTKQI